MKHSRTFIFALTVSACLCFAGRLVIGSGESEVRPLARSLGAATINDCRVTGRIEGRTNGVFAVFDLENPTKEEKEISFNYQASVTRPASMMSRMGPRPEALKKGTLECSVKEGLRTEEVLVQELAPKVDKADKSLPVTVAGVPATLGMPMTGEIWSLVVSREEIKGMHGWGAVAPAASDATISLDKGEAVLASTVMEKTAK